MPIGRNAIEGAVAAPAVTAFHYRIPAAQASPDLRQPRTVSSFVVGVWVNRIVDLFAGQAAGVNHFAVSGLEIDAMNKVAVDRSPLSEVRRTSKKCHLAAASLDRQRATHSRCQTSRPGTGRQNYRFASEPSLVCLDARDSTTVM